jgi:CheY-like chemotaxis protein
MEVGTERDDFLALVSHELRSPLNAIRGWAHLLDRSGPLTQQQKRALEAIERNAEVQARLIEDLLDRRRLLRGGEAVLERHRVALDAVVADAVQCIRPALDERAQVLAVTTCGARLDVDPHRLRQVLVNLLTNAVKFTPPCGRIGLRCACSGARLCIEVSDSGIGLAPEWARQVFEPFRHGAGQGRGSGLGLGLTLARQLVELHGGHLRASSEGPGRGSTFVIELPAAAPRVLVVEDDDDAREMLAQLLRHQGFDAVAFACAGDALDWLERIAADEAPDLIVSDIGLPDDDGYTFIRRVHSLHADRNELAPPSVALTAFTSDTARRRAVDAGFDAFLPKPLEPGRLQTTLERLLQPPDSRPVP